jgi:mono/diheme cytochrome c family protein
MRQLSRLSLMPTVALLVVLAAVHGWPRSPAQTLQPKKSAAWSEFEKTVKPFLAKHCFACHSADGPESDARLDLFLDESSLKKGAATLEQVQLMLDSRAMPPKKRKQPSEEELRPVLAWLEANIGMNCSGPKDPGRVTIRRLNRVEYNNTIRDLLAVDFKPGDAFPEDSGGHGFDNNADVLTLAPVLMEKYLAAAENVLGKAIFVQPVLPPPSKRWDAISLEGTIPKPMAKVAPPPDGRGRAAEPARLFEYNGEVNTDHEFPADGEYVIRLRAFKQGKKAEVSVLIDSKPLPQKLTIGEDQRNTSFYATKATRISAGMHRVEVALTNGAKPPANGAVADKGGAVLGVVSVEVEGPLAVTPERMPVSYRKVMIAYPSAKVTKKEAADKVIRNFATRAYRRPVRDDEVKRLLKIWAQADEAGDSFDKSVHFTLQAVLTSPHFLFRVELDPQPGEPNGVHTLNEFELATRLSYFLWSSMPDDELFALAAKGELRKALDAQIKRMLKDPKSHALVDNFAGQWLQLRLLYAHTPNAELFPAWDESLRIAMIRETELFFEHIMREDRSLLEFLDADYTFVNERLAQHYGLKAVKGDQFRRISLTGDQRGGLLTQASVLTITSYPDRTSPVQRGKWVLETLLGTPPPPPPPGVISLAEQKELKGTLRQRMEQHRVNPVCASCHQRMDPIGFGLENFDAIGRWRTSDGKEPIDSSGTLPTGKAFKGVKELKELLKAQPKLFGRCIADRMMTYALGRGLDGSDRCVINDIATVLEKNSYRFSTLILEIAKSDPFQKRTSKRSDK